MSAGFAAAALVLGVQCDDRRFDPAKHSVTVRGAGLDIAAVDSVEQARQQAGGFWPHVLSLGHDANGCCEAASGGVPPSTAGPCTVLN